MQRPPSPVLSLSHRELSAETGSAAWPLRPGHEGSVPRAERQRARRSEAAAAGHVLRPQTNQRSVSLTAAVNASERPQDPALYTQVSYSDLSANLHLNYTN